MNRNWSYYELRALFPELSPNAFAYLMQTLGRMTRGAYHSIADLKQLFPALSEQRLCDLLTLLGRTAELETPKIGNVSNMDKYTLIGDLVQLANAMEINELRNLLTSISVP